MSNPLHQGEVADPVRVVLVSDVRLYRDGIVWGLAGSTRIHITGTAETGTQALGHLHDGATSVLLVDMSLAEALPLIHAARISHPGVKIVAFAVGPGEEAVLECIEAGAAAYVARDGSLDDLISTIENVVRGEAFCTPRMAASLFRRVATLAGGQAEAPAVLLTHREQQIVELIDQGCSNREIAARLGIEVATAKNHVHHILEKLQVRRRAQIGLRLGWRARRANEMKAAHTTDLSSAAGS